MIFSREVVLLYQALYRKWRPRTFDDVVGQTHITDTLKRQVAAGRLSHAYLFTGTRGTGKTSCAKILARAVNCEHPVDGNPCNQCASCLGIENGSILDVLELDAASNNGVDQVRALRDEAVYTPAAVRKRVYIIDEVHMLSISAFNALLKILEEPPAHLMFILATTELHKVPATIKSRCQQFSFKRILPGDIARRLSFVAKEEGIDLSPEGAALLARLSDGGLRDALSLLDQCANPSGVIGEKEVLDALGLAGSLETAALMEQITAGNSAGALETLARLYANGKDVGALLGELSALARDLLLRATAPQGGTALLSGSYDETTLRRFTGQLSPQRLMQMLESIQTTLANLSRSGNRRTDAELCLLRLSDPALDQSVAGLSARIAQLEERLASGQISAPSATPAKTRKTSKKTETAAQKAEAPKVEDRPPWEEEERPPLPEEPGEWAPPVEEQPKPVRRRAAARTAPASPEVSAPAVQAMPAGGTSGGENLWPALVAALHKRIPMGVYTFLSKGNMVQGRLEGNVLTLWVDTDFTGNMIGRGNTLETVAAVAGAMLGRSVRCAVSVGRPPAVQQAEKPQTVDHLDELLEKGKTFDGMVIK